MTMKTKNIAILMLFVAVFTTSYAISEVHATYPDWQGAKWYWGATDYRYGSMTGFTGLSQSEIYSAIDSGRSAVGYGSDYQANKVTTGGNWITKTYWSDTSKYGQQTPDYDWLGYINNSDIELNYNSSITWYDGTSTSEPNMRAVATHELFHGVDMEHVFSTGSVMFHTYSYYDWQALSSDDIDQMVDIYG